MTKGLIITSIEAAIREVKEEIGVELEQFTYKSTIENFFVYDEIKYHEISIVHHTYISEEIKLPEGFYIFNRNDIKNIDVKPIALKKIIEEDGNSQRHIIQRRENENSCP